MIDSTTISGTPQAIRKTPRHSKRAANSAYLQKLSIIIPCYNEASTICVILDKIAESQLAFNIEKEIIIVNDCSNDDTDLMVKEYIEDNPGMPIKYVTHTVNLGKGASVHTGISFAGGDYILIQDADLEYDPSEYGLLLEPVLSGHADVVYGSRFIGGSPHRILFFWHTLGNKILTFFSNLLTNMNLTDAHTCWKLIPTRLIRQIELREKRFAFDAELNAKIIHTSKLRLYEVGVSYYGRTFAEGKKIRFKDAARSIWCLVRYSVFYFNRKKLSIEWYNEREQ
jgi:glycosyltransferase involved in cell wall biosynthesis